MTDQKTNVKNKAKQLQKILKSYGHDNLKYNQCLEAMSKVLYEKPWHTVSNQDQKGKNSYLQKEISLNEFLENNTGNVDKFNLGIAEDGKVILKDFGKEPNLLQVGVESVGKTYSLKYTLLSYLQNNSHHCRIFYTRLLRSRNEGEYDGFDEFSKFSVIDNMKKFDDILKLIEIELSTRRLLLNKYQCHNLDSYEKNENKIIDRIILVFEDFDYFIKELDFNKNYKNQDTVAAKFLFLLKLGRSCGIYFLANSQKAVALDLPPELINNFTQKKVFQTEPVESMYLLGNRDAEKMNSYKAVHDYGVLKMPFLKEIGDNNQIRKIIKSLKKPEGSSFVLDHNSDILNNL